MTSFLPGDIIKVTGGNMGTVSSIKVGGVDVPFTILDLYNLTFTLPAGTGSQTVALTGPGGAGSFNIQYLGAPSIRSLRPAEGAAAGGNRVLIEGEGFRDVRSVKFGAMAATFNVTHPQYIEATAPAGAGQVDVTVETGTGVSVGKPYTYFAHPVINGIAPAAGAPEGGAEVTIYGYNIGGATAVKFGTTDAASFRVVSANEIVAVAPPGTGVTYVWVVTPEGPADVRWGLETVEFTYKAVPVVTSLTPNTGPLTGGSTVYVEGRNFENTLWVQFGSVNTHTFSVVNSNRIAVLLPPGSGMVDVQVVTPEGMSQSSAASKFTYNSLPAVSSITPARGPVGGGSTITIQGGGFQNATSVTIGGVPAASYSIISGTQIRAVTPAGIPGLAEVAVSNANGPSVSLPGRGFTYVATPVITGLSPSGGGAPGTITINGTALRLPTSVTFGAANATVVSSSDTAIVVNVPAGTVGDVVDVVVTTVGGTTVVGPNTRFTYLAPLSIAVEGAIPSATVGAPFTATFKAAGGVSYTAVLEGSAPSGLTLASPAAETFVLSGAPTQAGAFNFSIKLTDAAGRVVIEPLSLTVAAPTLTIIPTTFPVAQRGVAFRFSLAADGGLRPHTFAVTSGDLPDGLTLDSATGVIAGVPTTVGTLAFVVTVSDASSPTPFQVQQSFTAVVEANAPVVTPRTVDAAYNTATPVDLAASITGPAATSVTVTTQPVHGSVSVSGLVVTYASTAGYVGPDSFAYTATGPGGTSEPAAVSITVQPPVFVFQPQTLPDATQAVAYSQTVSVSGGTGPYSFSIASGELPAGLTLSSTGVISGTATASGVFTFKVKVIDASTGLGASAIQPYVLTVGAPPAPVAEPKEVTVDIKPNPNGGGSAEIDLSTSVQYASGIQITRQPSHGTLTVDGFKVTYTPTPGYFGQDSFDYVAVPIANNPRARSARAAAAGATVTLTIAPPTLVFGQTTLPNGEEKVAYSQTLTASGGTAPYRFAVTTGALPAGLTLSTAGLLSGTPTVGGSFGFTVTATDSSTGTGPFSVAQAFTLSLKAAVPQVAAPIEVSTIQGREVVVDLTAGARGGPFTGAAVVSVAPAGAGEAKIVETGTAAARGYSLAFKSSGTFSGDATVTYTLSNTSGASAPGVVTVKVEARPDPSQDPDVRGIVTAQTDAALRMAETQIGNFGRRMESLHSAGSRRFQQGITLGFGFADGGLVDPWTQREIDMKRSFDFSPQAMAGMAAADPTKGLAHPRGLAAGGGAGGASGSGVAGEGQVSIWTGGSIQFGRRDARNGGPKFDFTTGGLSMGADLRLNERLAVGVGGGFGQSTADVGSKGSSVEASNYFGVLYGSLQPVDGAFIDGMVGYGKLDFDTRRKVSAGVLTPTDVYAVGSRSGDQLILSVSAGWDFRRGDLFLSPYARVSSITGTLDAYVERGAGAGNLRYEEQDLSSLKIALGARGERTFKTDLGLLTPRFRVEYQRELKDSELAKLSYDDWVGGPLFSVLADPFERDQWLIGIGGELRRKRSKFSLDYQGNLSSGRDFVSELTGQISFEF